jgi:1-deoxy-D-xylulose-5-phosphate synthase
MPGSAGLNQEQRKELGLQYVDVGIAEEQAVAMASGAAKNGAKPLVVTNTTFIQRAYDQISHDVCINNSSVTILLNYNSFDSLTDVTHLGIFGLAAYTNVPNLVVLAPTSKDEYLSMLDWSVDQREHPVMILIPGNQVTYREADKDFDRLNHFKVEEAGEKVAILALGDFYQRGEQLSAKIKADSPLTTQNLDTGFRVYRLDESNYEKVSLSPKEYKQDQLDLFAYNIKRDRTDHGVFAWTCPCRQKPWTVVPSTLSTKAILWLASPRALPIR